MTTTSTMTANEEAALRRRANELLATGPRPAPAMPRDADLPRMIHELDVRQAELEIQNAELRCARDDLEAALARLTDLFDLAPVAYFVLGRDRIIENVNHAGATLLGFARAKLAGAQLGAFVAPDDVAAFSACLERAQATGKPEVCQLAMAGAGLRPLYVQLEALADATRRSCRVVVLDITERKQYEEALKSASAEIDELYQNAPCGYHTLDARGCLRRINDTELAWLGHTRGELLGKTMFYDLIGRAHRREYTAALAALEHKGDLHGRQWELRCKDGRLLPVLVSARMRRNLRGEIVESRWTLLDMSVERQLAEMRAAHAQHGDELSRRFGAIRESAQRGPRKPVAPAAGGGNQPEDSSSGAT